MRLSSVRYVYQQGGLPGVGLRTAKTLLAPIAHLGSLIFYECDLAKPLPKTRTIDGITAREILPHETALFESAGGNLMETAIERFRRGERCFGGVESATGKLANCRWMTTAAGYIPEVSRYLILKPGETYIYDLMTMPEFRNRGVDSYVRHRTYSYLQDCGFTRIHAYIRADNYVSLRAGRALLRPLGRIWYVRLRGGSPLLLGTRQPGMPELAKVFSFPAPAAAAV